MKENLPAVLAPDESESAVPGARIVVRNLATGLERTVESNDLGYYAVPALPTGPYSVTVSKTGFQTQSVPQLILEVDQNATIKVSLKVGAISEAVSVTAETSALDTRTAIDRGDRECTGMRNVANLFDDLGRELTRGREDQHGLLGTVRVDAID